MEERQSKEEAGLRVKSRVISGDTGQDWIVCVLLCDSYLCVTCRTFICDPGPCPGAQCPHITAWPHVSTIPYQRLRSVPGHQHSNHWRFWFLIAACCSQRRIEFPPVILPHFYAVFKENCMTNDQCSSWLVTDAPVAALHFWVSWSARAAGFEDQLLRTEGHFKS